MLDVARNFIPKHVVLRTLDVMAAYKLNRLHLHLTDDQARKICQKYRYLRSGLEVGNNNYRYGSFPFFPPFLFFPFLVPCRPLFVPFPPFRSFFPFSLPLDAGPLKSSSGVWGETAAKIKFFAF